MGHGQRVLELAKSKKALNAGFFTNYRDQKKVYLLYKYRESEIFNEKNLNYSEKELDRLLVRLSNQMHAAANSTAINPRIPAGYTYFGQFVVHDIIRSSVFPISKGDGQAATAVNFETPALDLQSLYGVGDIGYSPLFGANDQGVSKGLFKLGSLDASRKPGQFEKGRHHDIPRIKAGPWCDGGPSGVPYEPLLADSRNADNLVISSLVVLFQEFHNIVFRWIESRFPNEHEPGRLARSMVEETYRRIVDVDLAPRLFGRSGWAGAKKRAGESPRLRVTGETAFAALRFGHAMVRARYAFNDDHDDHVGGLSAYLENLLAFSGLLPGDEVPVHESWKIDWRRFFDFTGVGGGSKHPQLNFARPLGPAMAAALMNAPGIRAAPPESMPGAKVGLAFRTLKRGIAIGLPTAQALLARLSRDKRLVAALDREEIAAKLTADRDSVRSSTVFQPVLTDHDIVLLSEKTPLFLYVLLESAIRESGLRLGQLGVLLVGDLFAGALAAKKRTARLEEFDWPSTMPQLVEFVEKHRD